MQSKKGKTRYFKTSHGLEVNVEAMRILRTVNPSESFHFYEAIGKPTGQNASNLTEFLATVKSVKTESLQFHLERKDFQNWIEKTLGDTTLARRIARTSTKQKGNIRAKIQSTLEKRIKELTGPTLTMTVNTEQTVTRREVQA
jgi:tryptophan 2,3-dioxygenase